MDGVACLATIDSLMIATAFWNFSSLMSRRVRERMALTSICPCFILKADSTRALRPLDAFEADYPRVYGMKITDGWESLTFFNEDKEHAKEVSIRLAGIEGRGGMGLDESKRYYVYDFWNDCLIGTFSGKDTLKQTLRKGEARQMAVREVLEYPQVLSTDRHLLQGALELSEVSWNPETKELSGIAELVEDEPMQVALAVNGFVPQSCSVDNNNAACFLKNVSDSVVKLSLRSQAGGKVQWKVRFSE